MTYNEAVKQMMVLVQYCPNTKIRQQYRDCINVFTSDRERIINDLKTFYKRLYITNLDLSYVPPTSEILAERGIIQQEMDIMLKMISQHLFNNVYNDTLDKTKNLLLQEIKERR